MYGAHSDEPTVVVPGREVPRAREPEVPWDEPGPVTLVRCLLLRGGSQRQSRFVRQAEFGLWRHLMESRHRVVVVAERASHWLSDRLASAEPGFEADACERLVRICCRIRGPGQLPMAVERYLPSEELEPAQSALLSHFEGRMVAHGLVLTPGYFMP